MAVNISYLVYSRYYQETGPPPVRQVKVKGQGDYSAHKSSIISR